MQAKEKKRGCVGGLDCFKLLECRIYLSIDEGFIYADITLTKVGFSRMMQSCHIHLILEKLHAL